MEAYTSFARVYDMFMDNVPYEVWSRYIVEKLRANGVNDTIAKYHFHYLSELFRYRRIRYTKSRPSAVMTEEYFNAIMERNIETSHIKSFGNFIKFICEQ